MLEKREERFKKCLSNFQARKNNIPVKPLSQSQEVSFPFFQSKEKSKENKIAESKDERAKHFSKMEKLIEHLQQYETTTLDLMTNTDPENSAFYEAHLDAVVSLLEKIEAVEEPEKLGPEDFDLIVTETPETKYKKSYWQLATEVYYCCAYYSFWGALGTSFALGLLGAVVGFLIGIIIGVILGGLVGLIISPFVDRVSYLHEYDKPCNHRYVTGEIFDTEILRKGYKAAFKEAPEFNKLSANEAVVEPKVVEEEPYNYWEIDLGMMS